MSPDHNACSVTGEILKCKTQTQRLALKKIDVVYNGGNYGRRQYQLSIYVAVAFTTITFQLLPVGCTQVFAFALQRSCLV